MLRTIDGSPATRSMQIQPKFGVDTPDMLLTLSLVGIGLLQATPLGIRKLDFGKHIRCAQEILVLPGPPRTR